MTDDTLTARRELLAVLLSRAERGVLLEAERPLLRLLVGAEVMAADQLDAARQLAENEQGRAVAMEARADRAEAVVYRLRQATREARAAAPAYTELAGYVEQMQAILDTPTDDPSPTPAAGEQTGVDDDDDLRARLRRAIRDIVDVRGSGAWEVLSWRAADAALEVLAPEDDEGDRVQCWHIEPGSGCDWDRCAQPERLAAGDAGQDPADGLATPTLDALRAGQAVWRGPIEGYGTGQPLGILGTLRDGEPIDVKQWGPGDPPNPPLGEGVQHCSPLVNADCPGHTGPPYCERAMSSPAWVLDDSRPCPTQSPDGGCAGTWMHPGDCTTNADDIPATPHADAPSEQQ